VWRGGSWMCLLNEGEDVTLPQPSGRKGQVGCVVARQDWTRTPLSALTYASGPSIGVGTHSQGGE